MSAGISPLIILVKMVKRKAPEIRLSAMTLFHVQAGKQVTGQRLAVGQENSSGQAHPVESDALTPGGRIRWRERGRAISRGFLRGLSPATGHPDNSRQLICLPFRGPTEKGNNGPGVFAHRAS
jgi:hypothetical protein